MYIFMQLFYYFFYNYVVELGFGGTRLAQPLHPRMHTKVHAHTTVMRRLGPIQQTGLDIQVEQLSDLVISCFKVELSTYFRDPVSSPSISLTK